MHRMLVSLLTPSHAFSLTSVSVPEDLPVLPLRSQRRCSPAPCLLISATWPCRVNGQPLREGGYEVHAAFGPFRAHECAVDAVAGLAAVAVGAVTEITVVPREGAEAGRVFSGTEVVQAHVTGEGRACWWWEPWAPCTQGNRTCKDKEFVQLCPNKIHISARPLLQKLFL